MKSLQYVAQTNLQRKLHIYPVINEDLMWPRIKSYHMVVFMQEKVSTLADISVDSMQKSHARFIFLSSFIYLFNYLFNYWELLLQPHPPEVCEKCLTVPSIKSRTYSRIICNISYCLIIKAINLKAGDDDSIACHMACVHNDSPSMFLLLLRISSSKCDCSRWLNKRTEYTLTFNSIRAERKAVHWTNRALLKYMHNGFIWFWMYFNVQW